jgi:hypothetical protein
VEEGSKTILIIDADTASRNYLLANNRHEPVATKFPNDSATLMLLQAASQMADLGQRMRGK